MVDLGVAGRRARAAARARMARERTVLRAVAETTVAAGIAWLIARRVLPEPRPVFAPLTAIIALGTSRGRRGARALQVSLGVAVGLGAADLIVRLVGVGTWQLMLVTALALLAAVLISGSDTLSIQAGVSGALVVAVGSVAAVVPYRFLEALVGAGVALLVSQILSPFDARRGLVRAVSRVLEELGAALRTAADGIEAAQDDWADRAQGRLRRARVRLVSAEELLAQGRRAAEVSRRRGERTAFARYEAAAEHLDLALADGRALLAAARRAQAAGGPPAPLVRSLGEVAALARCAGEDPIGSGEAVRARAHEIAQRVPAALTGDSRPSVHAVADLLVDLSDALRGVVCDDRPPAPPRRRPSATRAARSVASAGRGLRAAARR